MRATLRLFAVTLLCAALPALIVPMRAQPIPPAKQTCCASVPAKTMTEHGCKNHHGNSPAKDMSCCQACALGLAMLFVAPSSFVYAQTGEETFLSLSAKSDAMPHRPPVPPPRQLLVS